jgi:hypothetical protein
VRSRALRAIVETDDGAPGDNHRRPYINASESSIEHAVIPAGFG